MQTAVRKRAADFCFLGRYPHPGILRKFAREGAAVSSRYSPRIRSPLGGHTGTRRAQRGGCAGVKRAAAHWRRCASAGAARASFRRGDAGKAQCRAARRALPGAGSRSLPSGRRREAGRRRAWPREAHKGRVAGAAARGGHVAGRRGAGGLRGFPGQTWGRRGGRRARGGKAGAAPRCRGAAGGGAGKTAAPSAACVGFQATSAIEAAARAKKPVFAL